MPPSALDASLPRAVDAAIMRALDKDPANRFPTCLAFAEALEAALLQATATPTEVPFNSTAVQDDLREAVTVIVSRPKRRVVGAAVAVVVALGGIGSWVLAQRSAKRASLPATAISSPPPAKPLVAAPVVESPVPKLPKPVETKRFFPKVDAKTPQAKGPALTKTDPPQRRDDPLQGYQGPEAGQMVWTGAVEPGRN